MAGHLLRGTGSSQGHIPRILTREIEIGLIASMLSLKTLILATVLAVLFSGCATGQSSQQSNDTTVKGYIDTGMQKNW